MRNSQNVRLSGVLNTVCQLDCIVFELSLSVGSLGGCVVDELQHWRCLSTGHGKKHCAVERPSK